MAMSELQVTMRGTEAEHERERITRWGVTCGERSAEIVHEHGTQRLWVRDLRRPTKWTACVLDFGAALEVARRLLTDGAT